jgi:hypothetical protein
VFQVWAVCFGGTVYFVIAFCFPPVKDVAMFVFCVTIDVSRWRVLESVGVVIECMSGDRIGVEMGQEDGHGRR